MNEFTDEELVWLYQQSHKAHYINELYKRYYRKVWQRCLSFTRDPVLASDTTQDIFLKLVTKLNSFQGKSKFVTWLYTITKHSCVDQLRANAVERLRLTNLDELGDILADTGWDPYEEPDPSIDTYWHQLKTDEQYLLRMKYLKGQSMEEIAHSLHITMPAVKMRLKRSRDKLRHFCMQGYSVDFLPQES